MMSIPIPPSNYVDEDYPARPEIGDNCGSESSTLETDVCVWRYAPLVVHATQEEEEDTQNDLKYVERDPHSQNFLRKA